MALEISIVERPEQLASLSEEWSALCARSDQNEPTLSPLWLGQWWRVFGGQSGRRLKLARFVDGERLVGLVPLCARLFWHRPALPFRRLELLASGEDEADEICSDYLGPIAERGAEEEVARALAAALYSGALGGWDELVLPAMDGSRALPSLIAGALENAGLHAERRVTGTAPYIPLPSSWKGYLALLPSSRRYLVNRSLRDFAAFAGEPPRAHFAQNASELKEGQRILKALHQERWSEGGDPEAGVFRSPRFSAFHDGVMPKLLEAGALELGWLSARGEPFAAVYNSFWNVKVYFYQSGLKLEVPKGIRPGIVLHALAIERAIAAGLREYDFLAGDSQYKLQLALATRPLVEVRAVRAPLRERARLLTAFAIARSRTLRARLRRAP